MKMVTSRGLSETHARNFSSALEAINSHQTNGRKTQISTSTKKKNKNKESKNYLKFNLHARFKEKSSGHM